MRELSSQLFGWNFRLRLLAQDAQIELDYFRGLIFRFGILERVEDACHGFSRTSHWMEAGL